ncbi:HeH/LEM domain protein [compost metagenome]
MRSMRDFFGELFTDADGEKVRELVVAPSGKRSDGLTVAQLRDALAAKAIPIPEGAKKQDLADLLDGAK